MTTKASKLKLVECFEFKASEDDHRKQINKALNSLENISKDLTFISEESDQIPANKSLLSIFSPSICRLLSAPDCASPTIILPDCSTSSIKHLLNIITNGFSISSKVSFAEISDIISAASLLEIDLSKLSYDDVASKTSVEQQNIGADDMSNPELEEETFNMEVNAVMEEIREQISEDCAAPIKVKQEKLEKEPPIKEPTPFQVKKEKVDEIGDPPEKFLAIHTKCQICQKSESGLYALWKHYFNFHLYEELKIKFPHLIKENSCVTCQKKFSVEKTAFQHVGILHHKLNDILIGKNMMPLPTPKMKVASKPEDHSEAFQKTNFLSSIPQTKVISAKEDVSTKAQEIVKQPTAEMAEILMHEKAISLEETGNIRDKNTHSVSSYENRNEEIIDPKIRKYVDPHEKADPDNKKVLETALTNQDKDNIETPVIKKSFESDESEGQKPLGENVELTKNEAVKVPISQKSMDGNTLVNKSNENEDMSKSDEDASEFSKIRNIFSDDNSQTISLRCQICEHMEEGTQIYKLWKHYFSSHLYKEIKTFFSHLIKDQVCDLCKAKFKSEKTAFMHLSIQHQKINELLAIKQMMPLPLSRTMNKDSTIAAEDRNAPQESNLPNKDNGASIEEPTVSIKMRRISSRESNLGNKNNLVSQESNLSNKNNDAPSQESNLSSQKLNLSNKNRKSLIKESKNSNKSHEVNEVSPPETNSEQRKIKRKTSFEAIKETFENDESTLSGTISKNMNVKVQGSSSADIIDREGSAAAQTNNKKRKSIGTVISGLKFKTPKIDETRNDHKERESTKIAPQEKDSFDELTCQICSVQEINLTHIWRHYVDAHFKEAIKLSNCIQGNSCTPCNIRKFANKGDMIRHYGLYHDKVNHLLKDSGFRQISQPKNISLKKNKQVADAAENNKAVTTSMAIIREAHKEVDEQAKNQINAPNLPIAVSKRFTEEEIFHLKSEYQKNKYITEEDREELAQRTGMDKKRILDWFSQKRKLEKKISKKVLSMSSKRENETK